MFLFEKYIAKEKELDDIGLLDAFQRCPTFFVYSVWGLLPQLIKPEHRAYVEECINNPSPDSLESIAVEHFEKFIEGQHITWQQWLILIALERAVNNLSLKHISISSGHGIGKSSAIAILILWFLFCFENAQVPCTAPGSEQMHDILWKEASLWLDKMPPEYASLYEWSASYIRMRESPEAWFARARTARPDNLEALAGVHGEHVMYLIDEASGVIEGVFTKVEGALTKENALLVMISNHTRLIGTFHESQTTKKRKYQTLTFDSRESPIVDKSYAISIADKYGDDSDEFRYMVRGLAPNSESVDSKGFVPLLLETDIKEVPIDEDFTGVIRLGVDPSGAGKNKTVWVLRDNFRARKIAEEATSNDKSIAKKTLEIIKAYNIKARHIWIDNFGVGANVAIQVALASDGKIYPNGVNVDDAADDPEQFANKRAEASWRVRKWLRSGGELMRDNDWKQCLSIRYQRNTKSKIQIMSKKDMKNMGISSPDTFDALMLTFFEDDDYADEIKTTTPAQLPGGRQSTSSRLHDAV